MTDYGRDRLWRWQTVGGMTDCGATVISEHYKRHFLFTLHNYLIIILLSLYVALRDMKDLSFIVWQNPFNYHQMSNSTSPPSYSEVSTPASQSVDYPFTLQSNYPTTYHDYSVGGLDDPMSNSWTADELEPAMTATSPVRHPGQQQQSAPPVPDAVINMASKVSSDKKPFAYVADVNDIRQQRDRVRRRSASNLSSPVKHFELKIIRNQLSLCWKFDNCEVCGFVGCADSRCLLCRATNTCSTCLSSKRNLQLVCMAAHLPLWRRRALRLRRVTRQW